MMESHYCARHVCPGGVNISERHARYRSMRASEGTEVVLRSFGDSDVDISGAVCAGRHDFVLGGGIGKTCHSTQSGYARLFSRPYEAQRNRFDWRKALAFVKSKAG